MSREEFMMPEERLLPEFTADGHLEEGTVHAWLDGVFDVDAAAQVAAHVDGCASCTALVAEARGLMAGSSRILAALDVTPGGVVPAEDAARTAARIAGAVPVHKTVRTPPAVRRANRPWWYSAAAAAVLVLGVGGTVWMRGGSEALVTPPSTAEGPSTSQSPVQRPPAAQAVTPQPVAQQPVAQQPAVLQQPASLPTPNTVPLAEVVTTGVNPGVGRSRVATAAVAPQGAAGSAASDAARGAPMPPPPPSRTRDVAAFSARVAPAAEMAAPRRAMADAESRPRPYPGRPGNREQYDRIEDNPFLGVAGNPLSTFSIDVDRASYGNVRRFLQNGQRPPADAVRIEELINYFPYTLREPRGNDPVAITTEVTAAPWQPKHQLVRIALQSKRIATDALPPSNLVFLIDVSGSMMSPDKLPLVRQSLRLLVDQLRPQDRVAIVAYAGAAGLVLPSTSGDEKERIIQAIERLEAGGSTAGGAGIELAYRVARDHFLEHGNNRVILATDGDFNVGLSSDGELERLIERKRGEGTYLTILGFGTGNYQDAKMEKLAKRGNGNYGYVDGIDEARKMLVREMGATLVTVANDVKLQIEFNPRRVQAYRLIGYEDRLLRTEDFTDDRKDAGDLGAGHQVTALYEIVPVGVQGTVSLAETEPRRYETVAGDEPSSVRGNSDELLFVKLRYKRPGESTSRLMTHPVQARTERGSTDMRFASSVAAFGMLLRESPHKGNTSAAQVLEQARAALGEDEGGYRAEFIRLVERYRNLDVRAGERR